MLIGGILLASALYPNTTILQPDTENICQIELKSGAQPIEFATVKDTSALKEVTILVVDDAMSIGQSIVFTVQEQMGSKSLCQTTVAATEGNPITIPIQNPGAKLYLSASYESPLSNGTIDTRITLR